MFHHLFCSNRGHTQIEAILNSRPLVAKTGVPNVITLTPAHFLIGRSITKLPEPEMSPVKLSARFGHVKKLTETFWHVWRRDYLNQLQQRTKWETPTTNLVVNDVVLLKDDLSPPARWKLARVCEVMPDRGG
ncbi:hypothetical protein V9T40_006995 [Parthenolecanium corni]|uniref:DUF5641 domain-containing protein n=1 Tax=Parthenolecanium corni TaxID=536013 RepID=A0AAN9TUH3_9HEMI